MEIAQKTAEEEERYKQEMEKYSIIYSACYTQLGISFGFFTFCTHDFIFFIALAPWRESTTETGRRTGEEKTGPKAPGVHTGQQAHQRPHLKSKPAQLQRPRVLVSTHDTIIPLQRMGSLFNSSFIHFPACTSQSFPFLCMLSVSAPSLLS